MSALATETASPRRIQVTLVAYGLALALVTVMGLAVLNPGRLVMLTTRADGIASAQRVLDAGGPPLAGKKPSGRYEPIGVTDDQGIYLYGELVGHVTGEKDPYRVVKWIWLALFAITVAVAPLTYYRAFGWAAAVLAPLALAVLVASFGAIDIYWIVPWACVTLLPWVYVLARQWPRRTGAAIAAVAAIGLTASFATSIRSAAGLPIVLALAFVVLRAPAKWPLRIVTVVVLAVTYLAVTPLGFSALRSYRDDDLHQNLSKGFPTSHSLWHNTYIGLGFLPNRWRIQYRDAVAFETVKQVKPSAKYLSPPYNAEAKRLWRRAIGDDPGYFVKESSQKAVAIVGHTARYLAVLAVALAALAALGLLGGIRIPALLAVPAVLLGLVPPMLVMPMRSYELGLFGAVGVIAIAAIALLSEPLVESLRTRRLPAVGEWRRPAIGAAAAIVVLAVAWVATHGIDDRSANWQAKKPARPLVP